MWVRAKSSFAGHLQSGLRGASVPINSPQGGENRSHSCKAIARLLSPHLSTGVTPRQRAAGLCLFALDPPGKRVDTATIQKMAGRSRQPAGGQPLGCPVAVKRLAFSEGQCGAL